MICEGKFIDFLFYQSIEHSVEVKLSRHLPNCATISQFYFLALSSLIESEISEQVRRQIATEEPNKGL